MPDFFETPILNSPYGYPGQHWQLDDKHQPLNIIEPARRRSQLMTPIPATKKQKASGKQREMSLYATDDSETQEYNDNPVINEIRGYVEAWRNLPNPEQWQVTPETARLLKHWRHHDFQNQKPFFCQIEAVETAIWLTEVASKNRSRYRLFLDLLDDANRDANPELYRLALKLATGAGKTTVMAMLIAWQAVNAARHPGSKQFSKAFLVITPGITIRDRLQVLLPSDPESYFRTREMIPPEMLRDLESAKIVITNYHAFRLREKLEISRVGRALLQGAGNPIETIETEGEMLRRVMPDLMGTKGIVVLNDEAHHCYREKPRDIEEALTGEEKAEAEENNKAARLWISGIEAVKRKMGLNGVFDLSATPFFLRGSGYAEGTLFPWTVSDFSLMDAIECGIVKLPRIPVSDNMTDDEPRFRNLWENIRKEMPKKGRGAGKNLDPSALPNTLQSALRALYGHYEGEFGRWEEAGIPVPPVFIVVCNNTSTSKLVYDWIAGYDRESPEGPILQHGQLALFRNHDQHGNPFSRPRSLLIDSTQLEAGEGLDDSFREAASLEIEQFRRDLIERKKDAHAGDKLTDADLLREVMNTVGKEGRLGEQVRCVVSVSMLTEGWDANTVTHILGIRAFGTQLLCEQVVGRALRRQSYRLNPETGLFDVEYADVLGIPFDFASKVVATKSAPPIKTIRVKALPERAGLAITFPRVEGYRTELPPEDLKAAFTEDSCLELTPELIGPTSTLNQGILGKSVDLTLEHTDRRPSTVSYELAKHLMMEKYRDENGQPRMGLFLPLQRVARRWLEGGYLRCSPGLTASHLVEYPNVLAMAGNKIAAAITREYRGDKKVLAIIDPYNPAGSTRFVNFTTSKPTRLTQRSHVNLVTLDSDWEAVMCHVLDLHPRVRSYVKNQNLGFEVPYLDGAKPRRYLPDFIVQVDDGKPDPLNLIVEVKGYRGEDAKAKADTMHTYWVPGVNNLGAYGRWAFYEFRDPYSMQHELAARIEPELNRLLDVFAEGKEPAYAS